MKKMKQCKTRVARIISACMAAILIFAAVPTVAAASYSPAPPASAVSASDEGVAPVANDTEWVYRVYNGKKQMRLWSRTYAKWLTDWIDLE